MIAPLVPYGIKGALWYQGEANTGNAAAYVRLLPALIGNWRSKWAMPDMPFLYVQLPNFTEVQYLPSESQWAMLREAQLKTLSVPHTGMAVAIDLGEWNDIHPDRKKEVGQRLALLAEQVVYGEKDIVASGPVYENAVIDSNKIIISFKNTGTGLISLDGGALCQFAIAGADKKFTWAKASIENNRVIVWSDGIAAPKYVRYAWADNPDNPNLGNKEGLPASPFRTDP
jgi:sialate O-acetylesterase